MVSRLMLNLHSISTAGLFSTADSRTRAAFTSRAPDLNFEFAVRTTRNETDLEMDGKAPPTESLTTEYIVQEVGHHEIQMEWRNGPWYWIVQEWWYNMCIPKPKIVTGLTHQVGS